MLGQTLDLAAKWLILLENKSFKKSSISLDKGDKKSYIIPMKAENLRKIREKLDMTRAQLARALDVNERTVRRWENDETEIPRTVELALREIERPAAR